MKLNLRESKKRAKWEREKTQRRRGKEERAREKDPERNERVSFYKGKIFLKIKRKIVKLWETMNSRQKVRMQRGPSRKMVRGRSNQKETREGSLTRPKSKQFGAIRVNNEKTDKSIRRLLKNEKGRMSSNRRRTKERLASNEEKPSYSSVTKLKVRKLDEFSQNLNEKLFHPRKTTPRSKGNSQKSLEQDHRRSEPHEKSKRSMELEQETPELFGDQKEGTMLTNSGWFNAEKLEQSEKSDKDKSTTQPNGDCGVNTAKSAGSLGGHSSKTTQKARIPDSTAQKIKRDQNKQRKTDQDSPKENQKSKRNEHFMPKNMRERDFERKLDHKINNEELRDYFRVIYLKHKRNLLDWELFLQIIEKHCAIDSRLFDKLQSKL